MTDDVEPAPAAVCDAGLGGDVPRWGRQRSPASATDAAGNTGTGRSTCRSSDTTAPALTLPADFTIDVFDPKGLSANYLVTATDAADPAPVVVCTPPSGTLPPPGKTTVECTATDASGNSSAGSFVVTMLDARQAIARRARRYRPGHSVAR